MSLLANSSVCLKNRRSGAAASQQVGEIILNVIVPASFHSFKKYTLWVCQNYYLCFQSTIKSPICKEFMYSLYSACWVTFVSRIPHPIPPQSVGRVYMEMQKENYRLIMFILAHAWSFRLYRFSRKSNMYVAEISFIAREVTH